MFGINPPKFDRSKMDIPQHQRLQQAGKSRELIPFTEDVGGVSLTIMLDKPYLIFDTDELRYKWSYQDRWVLARDIRLACGASPTRFKHCLARLKGYQFDFEDGRKLTGRRSYYLDTKMFGKKMWVKEGTYWYTSTTAIVKDLASRRPLLPKARDWYCEITNSKAPAIK